MPKKKKWVPPRVKKTILIGCEWECEFVFLSYLKEMYHPRDGGFTVNFKNMQGWSPDIIVQKIQNEWHDLRYVWVDTDRPEIEQARILGQKAWICLFENNPCIEWEILRMLGTTKKVSNYKRAFERCFPGENLCDSKTYSKLFPKKKIEELRGNDEFAFESIIKLLETGEM